MMFARSPSGSNPTSPIPVHSPSPDCHSDGLSAALLPQSPPCWVTQAQRDLAQAEAELCRLQERHATETESVKRGVERAILGARREERRLLERVEQDHRDTQQRLEQVQRENMAAARVSQSLLDQRIRKLAQLQQRIQNLGGSVLSESGPNQNPLHKEVVEFLQPWEVSVSLKKVNFKPSSQPNAVAFGDIRVQEQSLCLNAGGCGPKGQPCALHSQEIQCEDTNHQGSGSEMGQGWTSPTGRVLRKISLSNRSELESEEEQRLSSAKISRWLPKCEQSDWESFQDDEMDSFQPQGEDVFLAVPTVLKNIDNEEKDLVYSMNGNGKQYSPRNQRKLLPAASNRKPSPSPERRREHLKLSHCFSLDSQDGDKGKVSQDSNSRQFRYGSGGLTSPRMNPRDSVASQSCLDLTCRGRPHSCLSQSSDEHSLGTLGDSGRAPSPTDSLDSSYTFIVSPSHDQKVTKSPLNSCRLSKSAVDLTPKTRPLISGVWRVKRSDLNSTSSSTPASPVLSRGPRVSDMGQTLLYPAYRSHQPQKKVAEAGSKQPLVARSLSMSVIGCSSQEAKRGRGEPALLELEEEGDPSFRVLNPGGIHPIVQFGKQGSGRADLTLPSGIHATPQGQLFIVDCGNARVQVTDPRGNVLQQVTSSSADGSARRCRNYFDIAVNAKGLIALSCAAERALLVFSRHGRLLQTYGGSGLSSAKDELEAPRGVTVTRLDEFLVADIRKGTLIALKLDPKTGSRLERTVVTGFHRPYLVAACLSSGMIAVSERGNETGRVPCIKVLEPGWNTVRVLGVCAGMGPVLACPWGICIDKDGNVLVADWGEQHRVLLYTAHGVGWPIINEGLSSPRGLTLLPGGQLAVSDSMHHCIKIYQYKAPQD
ncbi:uncharacterized protein LOC125017834 [Mugil cephalus]|uniref:uncharacterized protein LOC125017834 n=1 Tax=Mugil cephalus TaxID=48193 RepID=UPI001FB69472|nr:uncharacterized protein LOC125017834 [Mugil cephalus]